MSDQKINMNQAEIVGRFIAKRLEEISDLLGGKYGISILCRHLDPPPGDPRHLLMSNDHDDKAIVDAYVAIRAQPIIVVSKEGFHLVN